ncbi:hypothetical protein BH18GEM1_BH18GEM1_20550 [soil metagenome]
MIPLAGGGSTPDWKEFVAEARERIARKVERAEEARAAAPGADAGFTERYRHLLGEIGDLLEAIPEVLQEPHGPSGLRIHFAPTEREVRITPLEDQGLVHFVFGHTTLGTLHRAEHHASRPFGDGPPDAARLVRQLLAFLIEGAEPRWLTHRPPPDSPAVRETDPGSAVLELPLD